MKKYKLGMILGRFQIFHKGHESIINKALELCDEVIILIGSADKYGTYENPFNYDTRRIIIEEVYKDRVIIAPLNDLGVGNVPKWGDYVIESCKKIKDIPDLVIYGDEDKCKEWYHTKCLSFTNEQFQKYNGKGKIWFCPDCSKMDIEDKKNSDL